MNLQRKYWALLFLVISVAGVIALSSGISDIEISAEWHLYDFDNDDGSSSRGLSDELLKRLPKLPDAIWQIFSVVGLIIVPMAIVVALFSPEMRGALLREFRRMVPFIIMAVAIVYLLNRIQLSNLNPGDAGLLENPPDIPTWITSPTALAAFIIGLVVVSIFFLIMYLAWRRSQYRSLDRIANEASMAIDQIRAGVDYKNAVIECYSRMCVVLLEYRRIQRKESMTPREFARFLEDVGISGWHAHRLTNLFERVRYGGEESAKEDELEAVECLTAITQIAKKRSRVLSPDQKWKFEY